MASSLSAKPRGIAVLLLAASLLLVRTAAAGIAFTTVAPTFASTSGGTVIGFGVTLTAPSTTVTSATIDGIPVAVLAGGPGVSGGPVLFRSVVAPAHAAGQVTLVVTADDGSSASSTISYIELPVIGAATPVSRVSSSAVGAEPLPGGPDRAGNTGGAVSGTNRYVVLVSDADLGLGLAPLAGAGANRVYLKDRVTGELTLVDTCGNCRGASITLDGLAVAYLKTQPSGGTGAFIAPAPFAAPIRIDVDATGSPIEAGTVTAPPALSGLGLFVAFTSTANLDASPSDTPDTADLFVRDLALGQTVRWTTGSQIRGPSISADGRYIAVTTATPLAAEDLNGVSDVYLLDRAGATFRLLTPPAAASDAVNAVISAGGSVVAFTSAAAALVAGDSNGVGDVFVIDLPVGTISRVSVGTGGSQANAASLLASISGNGRRVAFMSEAGNLTSQPPPTSGGLTVAELYVHDRSSGQTLMIHAAGDGTTGDAGEVTGELAPDSRSALLSSLASNLAAGDSNALSDAWLKILPPDTPIGSSVRTDPFDVVRGRSPVSVVFSSVTIAGDTSVAIADAGPQLPDALAPASPYYTVSTTAGASAPIDVCLSYAGEAPANEGWLRLLVLDGTRWLDATTSVDVASKRVCGQTSVLSTFTLAAPANAYFSLTIVPGAVGLAAGSSRTLTVSVSGVGGAALQVSLSSSDTNVATAPAIVTIPAGLTSTTFEVAAGTATGSATLTATAATATPGTATVAVGTQVVEWTQDASGFWDDPANWSGGAVPVAGDVVIIDRAAGSFVVTVRTTTAAIQGLYATEQLAVSGSLVVAGAGSVHGGLQLTGSLAGSGSLALSSPATWTSGTVSLAGGLEVGAGQTLTIESANDHWLSNSLLRNRGLVVWSGGRIVYAGASAVANDPGAVWNAQGDLAIVWDGSGGAKTFTNAGMLRKSIGTGSLTFGGSVTLASTGTIELQSGTLAVAAPATSSGHLLLAGGTTFYLANVTLQAGSTFAGTGTLALNGTTTVAANVTVTVPTVLTSTVTGSGGLVMAAPMTWTSGFVSSLTGGLEIAPGQTLTIESTNDHWLSNSLLRNRGLVVWSGGRIVYAGTSAVANNPGAVWNAQGDLAIVWDGSGGAKTFTNAGTLRKSAGSAALSISGVTVTNTGALEVSSGSLSMSAATTSGLLDVAAGASLSLANVTLESGSTFSGTGTLAMDGTTTVTGGVTVTLPVVLTGTVTGGGGLIMAAPLTWTSGTVNLGGGLEITAGQTLTISSTNDHVLTNSLLRNRGTVAWSAGRVLFSGTSTISNETGAVWDAQGDLTITWDGSGGTKAFTNLGTLRKSAGAGALTIAAVPLTNSGAIEVLSGTLNATALTATGSIHVAAGASLSLANVTLDGSVTFSGAGTLAMDGTTTMTGAVTGTLPVVLTGTVTGAGALTMAAPLTWTSGTVNLAGGLEIAAGQILSIGSTSDHYLTNSLLRNRGTVSWSAGRVVYSGTSSIGNETGAVWDAQGDLTITWDGSGGTKAFNNLGTLRKSAGAGTLTIAAVTVTNTGTIGVLNGSLSVTGASTSGHLHAAASATVSLANVTLAAGSTFGGAGTLLMDGTTTIAANMAITLPVVLTGTVTGAGAVTMAAPLTWTSGAVNLGGGLEIAAGQTLSIGSTSDHYLAHSFLRNRGTVAWAAGRIIFSATSTVSNEAGALWAAAGDLTITWDGSGGAKTFANLGTLRKSAGVGALTIAAVTLTNTGTIEVLSGSLAFPGATTSGHLLVAAGATISLASVTLESGSTFAGGGTLAMNGTTTVAGTVTVTAPVVLTSTVTGTGALAIAAPMTWTSGVVNLGGGLEIAAGQTLTIDSASDHYVTNSVLRNRGTVAWTGGRILHSGTSLVSNEAGAFWDAQGDVTVAWDGSGGAKTFDNLGTLRKSGATGTLALAGVSFSSTGTIVLRLGGTGPGQFDRIAAGPMTLGGTLDVTTINGYTPSASDLVQVLTHTSRGGAFDTLVGHGLSFSTCYEPAAVVLCNMGGPATITPVLTWATPANIIYGTALSAAQLNATADAPGTFTYTPDLGAYLQAGADQPLVANFTPADPTTYETGMATVNLTVLPATLTVVPDDKTRTAGAPNPALTYTLTGFVLGETPAVVSGTPLLATPADETSPPGLHPITSAPGTLSAANYGFYFGIGTLTITPYLPPVAHDGVITTTQGLAVGGTLQASNPGGRTLGFSIVTPPTHGGVTLDEATGAVTYTPNAGAIGYDSFGFAVSDGTSTSGATQMVFVVASSPQRPGQIVRASLANDGSQSNEAAFANPWLSADGRFLAFSAFASDLVAGDTNGVMDVFVRDRLTAQTTRVSVASDGAQGNALSFQAVLSANGRYVAFRSSASNLVSGDTNGTDDVFVNDRQTGVTTRVSVSSTGTQANGASDSPALSADGRLVAYKSSASNLVAGDTNARTDIFVHDRQTGHTTRVSVGSNDAQADHNSDNPALSATGRFVAFRSGAPNLVAGDTNGTSDLFVRDRQTGETTRVSVASDGTQSDNFPQDATLSADGRFVAFGSLATNLVAGDTNGVVDIFVHDRQAGETTRVSVGSGGAQGNDDSGGPRVSADGRFVAFSSTASNLVPGDNNGTSDAFVHDRQAGQTVRVSLASGGAEGNNYSSVGAVSADGRFVALWSLASNLVAGDTNDVYDIFVVGGVDLAPVADDGTIATSEDSAVGGTLVASDPNGDSLTFGIVSNGALGTAVVTNVSTGTFSYTPNLDANGADTLTFKASDGTTDSNVATVTVTIAPVNDAPVASDGTLTTVANTPASGALAASDIDSPSPTFSIVSNGSKGVATVTNAATGAFTYTPNAGASGADSFTFKASDGGADSNIATVNVTITSANGAPVARAGVATTSEGAAVSGVLQATDPEGDALSFSVVAPPARGVVTMTDAATGAFTYTPNAGAIGYDPFTFTVSDSTESSLATQMVFVVSAAPRWPGQTVRVSVASSGAQAIGHSRRAATSADGRFVAFASLAADLVAGDTNGGQDVFVHDRQTQQTTRVSVAGNGAQANGASDQPAISADGRFIAFPSFASNLVAGDTNSVADVFVHDRQTGNTTRVSIASDGAQANNGIGLETVALSADGRHVAFRSAASNLVAGDTNNTTDIFVHDRHTGETTRASLASDGTQANSNSFEPSLSADGRFVAFRSSASNLVAGDTNLTFDIFVHDRLTSQTTRVSITSSGGQGSGISPKISADGRFVTFESGSPLTADDTNGTGDVFIHDRQAEQTTRVSLASGGAQANSFSVAPTVSANGRFVAFFSWASNLVAGDTNGTHDAFVHDRLTGQTTRVSVAGDGSQADGENSGVSLSADGRFVAFQSLGANLVDGDTNGTDDVFVVGGASVSPLTATFGSPGGMGTTDVSFVYPGTAWSAASNDGWITVTDQSSTTGNGTVSYTVSANSAQSPRTGTLRVAAQTVTIQQEAPPERITPVITWATPAPLTYGAPLGGAQLNATADVAGTFSYAPALGTHLQAGTDQPLVATFTPTDTTTYETASATVYLTVLPATLTVTPDDRTKVAGTSNPPLTYTIGGFVLGETAAVVSGAPQLSTPADDTSPAGTYPINAALGTLSAANYTFAFGTGTLTVTTSSVFLCSGYVHAPGTIHTFAGTGLAGFGGDLGVATGAALDLPFGTAVGDGVLFLADTNNHRVRRVNLTTCVIDTVAGTGTPGFLGDNGPATSARLNAPRGVAVAGGVLFIADTNNHRVRRVDLATGVITTVAGSGNFTFGGDNGPAAAAGINGPVKVTVVDGVLYVADRGNHRIRRVDLATGTILTIAGNGTAAYAGDNGPATTASLSSPSDMGVASGGLFIADFGNNRVRRVDLATGAIATAAGSGSGGLGSDGPAATASVWGPRGIAIDGTTVFIAEESGHRVRQLDLPTSTITTLAGTGAAGFSGDAGPAATAQMRNPQGVAVGPGAYYLADTFNHRIRQVDALVAQAPLVVTGAPGSAVNGATFTVSTTGGSGTGAVTFTATGACTNTDGGALITMTASSGTCAITATKAGDALYRPATSQTLVQAVVFLCDGYVHAPGTIHTFAGTGPAGFGGDLGVATGAALDLPFGTAVGDGVLFLADTNNHRVRRVNLTTCVIDTVAGTGTPGFLGDNGPATSARLNAPRGVAVAGGVLFIADTNNHRVRRVDLATGVITTVAGSGNFTFGGDNGPAAAAGINGPVKVTVVDGVLYVADRGNHRIRRVDLATGTILTIAGNGTAAYAGDNGPATTASLSSPSDMGVASGGLFIADFGNNRVRRVDLATGAIATAAGSGSGGLGSDGPAATASVWGPRGIAIDGTTVFIAEESGHRVRQLDLPTSTITTLAGTGVAGFSGDAGPAATAQVRNPQGVAVGVGALYVADTFNHRIRQVDILVAQAPLTLTGAPASADNGTSFTVGTAGGSGTGAVTFTATGACTNTDGGALITMTVSSGVCTITATKAADTLYAEATSAAVPVAATSPLSVAMISPNGGERVFVGLASSVQWSATGSPTAIDLELSRNGGTSFTGIPGCTNLPGTATSCAWTPTTPGTTNALIRVTASAGSGTASDVSDAAFTISTATPSITVTSPNTAVSWASGSLQSIDWSHNLGSEAAVRIELSRDGGGLWEVLATAVPNTTNTAGSFAWTVTGPTTTTALIRIASLDTPATDASNTAFSIVAPSVTVTAPNTAVTWRSGTSRTITFSHNLSAGQTMQIDVSRDGGASWAPLASVVTTAAASGSYDWMVNGPATAQARVRVTWAGDAGVSDASDADFTIASRFVVTAPNTAVTWAAGSTRTITWSHNLAASDAVDIAFSPDAGATWVPLASNVANASASAGSHTVAMPDTPTAQGLIRVAWSASAQEYDVSDVPFTLALPAVTVTAPNTSVSWTIGTSRSITWSHNLGTAESVRIDVSRDGGATWSTAAASAANSAATSGSFTWIVDGPATTAARVRVAWTRNEAAQDGSDVDFLIPSAITVTAPNTAVVWAAGSTRTITWNHSLGSSAVFDLDVSVDGGATWSALAAGVPAVTAATGTFTADLPATVTTQALIRVSPAGAPSWGDVSNVPFTLAAPAVAVTAPNTNVAWTIGTSRTVSWTHNLGTAEAVRIDVSRDGGGTWTPLATGVANSGMSSGTFTWIVDGPVTTAARIRVTWTAEASAQDASDVDFRILPAISVTSPNTALVWGAGSTRTITWNHGLGSTATFDVALSIDGGASWTSLASGVPAATAGTGAHTTPMPTTTTGSALVRVSPAGQPDWGDASNVPFALAVPAITVTAPNTNVNWTIGSNRQITWTHNLGTAEAVDVEVSRDGGATWTPIATALASSGNTNGSFTWTVTGPATTAGRVRVMWGRNTSVSDVGNVNFRIQ